MRDLFSFCCSQRVLNIPAPRVAPYCISHSFHHCYLSMFTFVSLIYFFPKWRNFYVLRPWRRLMQPTCSAYLCSHMESADRATWPTIQNKSIHSTETFSRNEGVNDKKWRKNRHHSSSLIFFCCKKQNGKKTFWSFAMASRLVTREVMRMMAQLLFITRNGASSFYKIKPTYVYMKISKIRPCIWVRKGKKGGVGLILKVK